MSDYQTAEFSLLLSALEAPKMRLPQVRDSYPQTRFRDETAREICGSSMELLDGATGVNEAEITGHLRDRLGVQHPVTLKWIEVSGWSRAGLKEEEEFKTHLRRKGEVDKRYDTAASMDKIQKAQSLEDVKKLIEEADEQEEDATGSVDQEIVERVDPWKEPVILEDLVTEMEGRLMRHLVLPDHGALAISLWTAAAYIYDIFRIFPRLVIFSPTKRCGKTTTLELIEAMAPRALLSSNISPAAVFRVIQNHRPTLLIDEADSFVGGNDELRGIINSSHNKRAAKTIRCVGDKHDESVFSTWAPIVLAGINKAADTIMDRALVLPLQRKLATDQVEKLPATLFEDLYPLRQKLARWTLDNENLMRNRTPRLPVSGNDRAEDNWLPIFVIAEEVSDDCAERCTQAFAALEAEEADDTPTQLLRDIQTVIREDLQEHVVPTVVKEGHVLSTPLLSSLVELEDRPWKAWGRTGKGFSAYHLSRHLKGFNLSPRNKKLPEGKVHRGYDLEQLEKVIDLYVSGE